MRPFYVWNVARDLIAETWNQKVWNSMNNNFTCIHTIMLLLSTMLPATSWMHYTTSCNTQSSAPEDGQNNFSKHVELTGNINKPLLLHLVGCLYYLYQWCTVKQISDNEIYLLFKYIKSVLWRVAKRLSYIQDARCLKVKGVWQFAIQRDDRIRQ